jgi:hypothetical protein
MAKKKVDKEKKKSVNIVRISGKKLEEAMESQVNKVLVENFVSLQKVMVDTSIKFDNLAGQISKLLELFEISAKSLAEKDFESEKISKDNKKILERIEAILEQNRTIARGLTLMNEKIEDTITTTEVVEPLPPLFPNTQFSSQQFNNSNNQINPVPKPLPPPSIKTSRPMLRQNEGGDEYKKSISSKST